LEVQIRGSDLPGRRCGPGPEGRMYDDIHVGLARRGDTVELRPGDAPSVCWTFEVRVRRHHNGQLDFGGPYVHGARGQRSLGFRWGTLAADDTFDVFRAAKLRFADIDPTLLERALSTGSRLVAGPGPHRSQRRSRLRQRAATRRLLVHRDRLTTGCRRPKKAWLGGRASRRFSRAQAAGAGLGPWRLKAELPHIQIRHAGSTALPPKLPAPPSNPGGGLTPPCQPLVRQLPGRNR
jgi:hypothetical protein